jgi:hypothetical protein
MSAPLRSVLSQLQNLIMQLANACISAFVDLPAIARPDHHGTSPAFRNPLYLTQAADG